MKVARLRKACVAIVELDRANPWLRVRRRLRRRPGMKCLDANINRAPSRKGLSDFAAKRLKIIAQPRKLSGLGNGDPGTRPEGATDLSPKAIDLGFDHFPERETSGGDRQRIRSPFQGESWDGVTQG